MEDVEGIRSYLKEMVNKEIIMKYLFIKSMEGNYDDKYIARKYKINVASTRIQYNSLSQDEKSKIERDIKAKIENGEIDLHEEAVRWHREGLLNSKKKNEISNDKRGR